MPLQNRVDPFGALCATPQRGLFMGNRGGKIHNPITKTVLNRRYASRRWIICTCVYKDWHRVVMSEGYTELFFLDEITALSAGHRPCALCRRGAFNQYRKCSGQSEISVDATDRILHAQRLGVKPSYVASSVAAPDGLMVSIAQISYVKRGKQALRWSFDGYASAGTWAALSGENSVVLTPSLTLTALQNGYAPVWHPSAAL